MRIRENMQLFILLKTSILYNYYQYFNIFGHVMNWHN